MDRQRSVVFASEVYALETIKRAAYRFTDVMSVDIAPRGDTIECLLHFNEGQTEEARDVIVSAFRNEVLDQDLRVTIAKETEGVRNAILAYALSRTGLQDGE